MDDWNTPVFHYCERLSVGWWGEPLNVLSNLGFLLAALLAWRLAGRTNPSSPPSPAWSNKPACRTTRLLAVLLGLVGCASLGFHLRATKGTGLLDVLAILVFNLAFLTLTLRGPLQLRWRGVVPAVLGFLALGVGVQSLPAPDGLRDSISYLPPLLVLLVLAGALRQRAPASAGLYLGAAVLFLLSLTLRTLDQPLCGLWSPGLHWIWHLLNAVVLWLLIRGLHLANHAGHSGGLAG